MDYQIKIDRPWPYRDPKRGRVSLAPGVYGVPEQIPDEIAQRALAEGMATKIYVTKPPVPAAQAGEPQPAGKKPKRGGRRAKGPAPENKAAHVPENKLPLH